MLSRNVCICETTRYDVTEDSNIHINRREKLKSDPYQGDALDYVQEEFILQLNNSQVLKKRFCSAEGFLMPSCSRPVHKKSTLLGIIDSEGEDTKILRIFSQLLRYESETSQKSYISNIITVRISILHYDQQNSSRGTTR